MENKIIQIIPAPTNLFVSYKDTEGRHEEDRIESPVLCLALTKGGEILLMDLGGDGVVDNAITASNFVGAYFGENEE